MNFAKGLADVDAAVRNDSFLKLKDYLLEHKDLSRLDNLKIWKMLFFCYWHCDKRNAQLDFAECLSDLAVSQNIEFLYGFWETICREWNGIDKHRIDKYFSLLRYMHYAALRMIQNSFDLVQKHTDLLLQFPLNPVSLKVPNGIKYHTIDVFLNILTDTISDKTKYKEILTPFLELKQQTKSSVVLEKLKKYDLFH